MTKSKENPSSEIDGPGRRVIWHLIEMKAVLQMLEGAVIELMYEGAHDGQGVRSRKVSTKKKR